MRNLQTRVHCPHCDLRKPAFRSSLTLVSTGFATVHDNNTLTINAVDAYPLEAFSKDSVRSGLAEANKVIASSAPEAEKAEAKIEADVFEALQAALTK